MSIWRRRRPRVKFYIIRNTNGRVVFLATSATVQKRDKERIEQQLLRVVSDPAVTEFWI